MKNCQIYKIILNVETELAGKNIDRAEKACLVNSDRNIISSGQRSYFFEQKTGYQDQIEKLTQEKIDLIDNLKNLNVDHNLRVTELEMTISRLTTQLENFRSFEKTYTHFGTQTEVDLLEFRKMHMNHDSVIFIKSLVNQNVN